MFNCKRNLWMLLTDCEDIKGMVSDYFELGRLGGMEIIELVLNWE